ncbi:hypothetical protein COT95_01240, partial [Candidatus Falkowbacteria bacterium CG10_big_fil_rev_8_21_14_0_10_37_6]
CRDTLKSGKLSYISLATVCSLLKSNHTTRHTKAKTIANITQINGDKTILSNKTSVFFFIVFSLSFLKDRLKKLNIASYKNFGIVSTKKAFDAKQIITILKKIKA